MYTNNSPRVRSIGFDSDRAILRQTDDPSIMDSCFLTNQHEGTNMRQLFFLACALFLTSTLSADVRLPSIIASKMVLQRDVPAPIWGWADKGEEVTVEFAGQSKKATASGEKGEWMIKLDPLKASSEPRVMIIKGKNEIKLDDILVGEVWLASGQSNMEYSISQVPKEEKDYLYTQSGNKLFRMFCIPDRISTPIVLDDTDGSWSTCPEFIGDLKKNKIPGYYSHSAVGCFFGLALQRQLGIPVGVIDSSWGGQRIERFISDEGYESTGLKHRKVDKKDYPKLMEDYKSKLTKMETFKKALSTGLLTPYPDAPSTWVDNGIYNGMIGPLAPFPVQGAIWYQGESNRGAKDYFQKLQALSQGWSKSFGIENIPLYLVQIAPFDYCRGNKKGDTTICDSIWSAQYKGAEEIQGMEVVAIHDTKIPIKNIHPPYKKTVGDRLAAMALNKKYGKKVPCSGPKFSSATRDGKNVTVSFSNVDQGLATQDGKAPSWFELSEDGKSFVTAQATIKGDKVEVTAAELDNPQYVRMGWCEIAIPNLQDKNGWPVFAFPAKKVN